MMVQSKIHDVAGIIKNLILLLVLCFSTSCKPSLTKFSVSDKKQLSSKIWLYRTSANVVSIADEDGMSLVYGNVFRIGYVGYNQERVRVAFSSSMYSNQPDISTTNSAYQVAEIDLATKKVTEIPDPNGRIASSLKEVTVFFP